MSDKLQIFDVRNFGGTMREILFFRTRQINRPDDANSFWQAQSEITALRQKLEKAYNSGVQKAKQKKESPAELWMFGLCAYKLIVIDGESIESVTRMSGAKLAKQSLKLGGDLLADGELHDSFFMFEKLMPEEK